MTKPIWNGTGTLVDGQVYFMLNDGTLVGRSYVRTRVRRYLRRHFPADVVDECLARTVDNDEWLAWRNQSLVVAVCGDAFSALVQS
jgi:hypothetical protein